MGEEKEERKSAATGTELHVIASGITGVSTAWRKAPIAVKVLVFIIVLGGTVTGSFVAIWKTVSPKKEGVSVGTNVGPIGDRSTQNLSVHQSIRNEEGGFLPPEQLPNRQEANFWMNPVIVRRAAGFWNPPTKLLIKFDGPFLGKPSETQMIGPPWGVHIYGGFGSMINGLLIVKPENGEFYFETSETPASDVVLKFPSEKPLKLVPSESGVAPAARRDPLAK